MNILALDPGTKQTAYVYFVSGCVEDKGILPNEEMVTLVRIFARPVDVVAIEFIQCYGMAVGREVFETVYWTGQIAHQAKLRGFEVKRFGRVTVKTWVTGMGRATDTNVHQALMLKYGGTKKGEPLHGVKKDIWAALAVATYVHEASKTGELREW